MPGIGARGLVVAGDADADAVRRWGQVFAIVNTAVVGFVVGGRWRWYVIGEGALAAGLANRSHSEHGCGEYFT